MLYDDFRPLRDGHAATIPEAQDRQLHAVVPKLRANIAGQRLADHEFQLAIAEFYDVGPPEAVDRPAVAAKQFSRRCRRAVILDKYRQIHVMFEIGHEIEIGPRDERLRRDAELSLPALHIVGNRDPKARNTLARRRRYPGAEQLDAFEDKAMASCGSGKTCSLLRRSSTSPWKSTRALGGTGGQCVASLKAIGEVQTAKSPINNS
jgi:hypothetical protein